MTLLFSVFALYTIFLVVSLLENLDEFIKANVPVFTIIKYYLYFFPGILKILLPVAMLISILFSVGKMASNNEVTALKTGGMSLYRLMTPLVVVSIFISGLHLYFNGWVVPEANKRKLSIDREDLKKNIKSKSLYDLYLRNTPSENLVINHYMPLKKSGNKVRLEKFGDPQSPRLIKSIEAANMVWDSSRASWIFSNVLIRDFARDTVLVSRLDTMIADLTVTHSEIEKLIKTTEEMTFEENREYVELLEKGGKDVRPQLIDYYGQYAYPFANIIVVLFGVPFASIKKKGGVAVQITAALVISFLYLIFTKLSQSLGVNTGLDPILMAWAANMIFLFLAMVIIYRTNT